MKGKLSRVGGKVPIVVLENNPRYSSARARIDEMERRWHKDAMGD